MVTDSKLEEVIDLLAKYGGFNREYLRDKFLTSSKEEVAHNNEEKIKPCLCGSVPSLVYEKVGYYDDSMYFFIHCEKCGIKMEGVPHSPFLTNEEKIKFEEETVKKWNAWVSKIK